MRRFTLFLLLVGAVQLAKELPVFTPACFFKNLAPGHAMTLRILIAEDDPRTRSALVEILQREGYEASSAASGLEAIRMFDSSPYELVCLDVMMPGKSGYDVCRHIRASNPKIPILFITAKAEEIDKVVGLELGDRLEALEAYPTN